jgi:hypothetical protein
MWELSTHEPGMSVAEKQHPWLGSEICIGACREAVRAAVWRCPQLHPSPLLPLHLTGGARRRRVLGPGASGSGSYAWGVWARGRQAAYGVDGASHGRRLDLECIMRAASADRGSICMLHWIRPATSVSLTKDDGRKVIFPQFILGRKLKYIFRWPLQVDGS